MTERSNHDGLSEAYFYGEQDNIRTVGKLGIGDCYDGWIHPVDVTDSEALLIEGDLSYPYGLHGYTTEQLRQMTDGDYNGSTPSY